MACNQIQQLAGRYTQYDMIQTHTELPQFPAYRTSLLYAFLKYEPSLPSQPDRHDETLALATSLVQLGLDTHDLVELTNDPTDEAKMRANQLKVLAGDYLSSRFYQLLAQLGQMELIKKLSIAICEVNRLKMNMYLAMSQADLTHDEFLQHVIQIKVQLFTVFTPCLNKQISDTWMDLLFGFARSEALIERIEQTQERSELHSLLEQQIAALLEQIKQLESKKLMEECHLIIEPLLKYVAVPQTFEGK